MQKYTFTLQRHGDFEPVCGGRRITTPYEAAQALREAYRRDGADIEDTERLYCLFLNRGNAVTGWSQVSSGGTDSVIIDARVVLRQALLANAPSIIIGHNHPSGLTKPSAEDLRATDSMRRAADAVGVSLVDHIILTHDSHYSFSDDRPCAAR